MQELEGLVEDSQSLRRGEVGQSRKRLLNKIWMHEFGGEKSASMNQILTGNNNNNKKKILISSSFRTLNDQLNY